MSNITQLTAVPSDLVGAQAIPTPAPAAAAPSGPSKPQGSSASAQAPRPTDVNAESNQRLVISQGANKGVYVYTILDRATGQVLVQIPRAEVLRIAARPDYSAGAVLDTKV